MREEGRGSRDEEKEREKGGGGVGTGALIGTFLQSTAASGMSPPASTPSPSSCGLAAEGSVSMVSAQESTTRHYTAGRDATFDEANVDFPGGHGAMYRR